MKTILIFLMMITKMSIVLAATCMNLLKLPEYRDIETLRERLEYAITAQAGFELS